MLPPAKPDCVAVSRRFARAKAVVRLWPAAFLKTSGLKPRVIVVAYKYVYATLAELRDTMRDLLKEEDERGNSLNIRASALTGFVGVILSVAAAAGLTGGVGDQPGRDWVKALVVMLMTAALTSLIFAVGAAVFFVLRPQRGVTVGLNDTAKFNETDFTSLEPPSIHRYLIDAYGQALTVARNRNDKKASWLTASYAALLVGVAAVALAGFTATLDSYVGGAPDERPDRSELRGHGWPDRGRADEPRRRGRR